MRAFFANGVDEMHIPWAVEGLPTLLHLSVFLFFGGVVIFLFNVDQEVLTGVAWWIGLFSVAYGLITLLPLIRQDSPCYAPLSTPVWFLYASIPYITFKVLAFINSGSYGSDLTRERCGNLRDRYRGWMLGGVEKRAEETVEEQSSEIDVGILGWTISALGDDDSLERFFEAIPGFFDSGLVKHLERDFPETLLETFWWALDGFIGRTLSSNLVTESVKSHRIIICRDIMSMIPCFSNFMHNNLHIHFYQAPVSIERIQAMARWFTHMSSYVSYSVRARVAKNLARLQERDGRWIALASDVYGLSERDLQDNAALGGDNVLLAILIHVSRRAIHSHKLGLVVAVTQFDIRHTLPGLQHDFCTLWNDLVQEARNRGFYTTPVHILRRMRHLYIALHQGTDAAPTAFSASTDSLDSILRQPSSYPLCDIVSHRPGSTTHFPVSNSHDVPLLTQPGDSTNASPYLPSHGGTTVPQGPQRAEQANIIVGPLSQSNQTTTSIIGGTSHTPLATPLTNPVHSSPPPTLADTSPTGGVATVLQDIPSAASLSYTLEVGTQQDIVAPWAEPDIGENWFTASMPASPVHTPTLAPLQASTPHVLNKSSASCDTGPAPTSDPLLPTPSIVGFSISTSPRPSCVPLMPNAKFFSLLGNTPPSRPSGNTTLLRLRARGLVNAGSMCFVNTVLQLLVYPPPVWDLFKELGDLNGRQVAGGAGTGAGSTPLVDATVRLFEEFMIEEKDPPPAQQPPQQTAGGKAREGEEEIKCDAVDPFEPTYMYDAMKEGRQLKNLLVRFCAMALVPCCY
jgi:hypothetical protein